MAVTDFAEIVAAARRASLRDSWAQEGDTPPSTDSPFANFKFGPNGRDGIPEVQSSPTTATALSYSTHREYSIDHPRALTGDIRLGSAYQPGLVMTAATPFHGLMVDMLCIQGGLVFNTTSAQTTNLPTPALPTRATGGAGVWIAMNVYEGTGSTDFTITASYTNQAGTAGRSAQFDVFATPTDGTFIILPLQAGDTGVRSVESVTLSATNSTAGAFGIMLFRPLFLTPPIVGSVDFTHLAGWNTPIDDEAVLAFLHHRNGLSQTHASSCCFTFFEA